MPFKRTKKSLEATVEERAILNKLALSRTESKSKVDRAKRILRYIEGESISAIAKAFNDSRQNINSLINKALELGILTALEDIKRSGKPKVITDEALAWMLNIACQKPKDFGYSYEVWSMQLLANHLRENCLKNGHECFAKIQKGTVSKLLKKQNLKVHKIKYYVERRDPEFDDKMAKVLCIYKEIQIAREIKREDSKSDLIGYMSYDEKPGIQALGAKSDDLLPVPGKYPYISRDYEYIRHGTLSLLSGIDLLTGNIIATIEEQHTSKEFIKFLKEVDNYYKDMTKIKIILDNHSIHVSKETRAYLSTNPNRFEFIFTPKHGSWLNIVETFFSKLSRTMLRGIKVKSLEELKERLRQFIEECNRNPVVFRWQYKMEELDC